METKIISYAPVMIPTLNRYEHFKRCLESLERCSGADKTEVYVGLDYPPSKKYIDGWKKIDKYLEEKEHNNNFAKLIVKRRDHNLGTCNENSNSKTLRSELPQNTWCYICTEDDNEFSPCFLEYMNKCLERFKDDARINLVCGYSYVVDYPEMYKNNFYITKWGCPWGTGHWVKKEKELENFFSLDGLKNTIKDDESIRLLEKRSPDTIRNIISMLKGEQIFGDAIRGVCKVLYDTYCIMPRFSMVRNYGNDGTGDHSKRINNDQNDFYVTQPISNETHFEFTNDIFTYEPVYMERHNFIPKMTLYRWLRKIHSDLCFKIDYFLFRHFDYIPKSRWI